jgi:hypothetical protein
MEGPQGRSAGKEPREGAEGRGEAKGRREGAEGRAEGTSEGRGGRKGRREGAEGRGGGKVRREGETHHQTWEEALRVGQPFMRVDTMAWPPSEAKDRSMPCRSTGELPSMPIWKKTHWPGLIRPDTMFPRDRSRSGPSHHLPP